MAIRDATRDTSSSSLTAVQVSMSTTSCSSSLVAVAKELEQLRQLPPHHDGVHFPPACHALLLSIPGNHHCADCGAPRPEWASVSYGIMICVSCCGRHRSYGVWHSRVKSVEMDSWKYSQVMAMLEGGNEQLLTFFERHQMDKSSMRNKRYKTKGALFYRTHLQRHVEDVAGMGVYEGREATRRRCVAAKPTSSTTVHVSQHTPSQALVERGNTVQAQEIAAG